LKSWVFASTAQNFAVNDFNRHLGAAFANADGVALDVGIHLCQEGAGLLFGLVAE
jgi:hypothetical protein